MLLFSKFLYSFFRILNFFQDFEEISSRHLTKDVKRKLDRTLKDFETINLVVKKLTDPKVPINGNNEYFKFIFLFDLYLYFLMFWKIV